MFTRASPASRSAGASLTRRMALVVMDTSSGPFSPSMAAISRTTSTTSRRSNGSPPVSRTSTMPRAAATWATRESSSVVRMFSLESQGTPSAGMQYVQRRLHTSVREMRRSRCTRPKESTNGRVRFADTDISHLQRLGHSWGSSCRPHPGVRAVTEDLLLPHRKFGLHAFHQRAAYLERFGAMGRTGADHDGDTSYLHGTHTVAGRHHDFRVRLRHLGADPLQDGFGIGMGHVLEIVHGAGRIRTVVPHDAHEVRQGPVRRGTDRLQVGVQTQRLTGDRGEGHIHQ